MSTTASTGHNSIEAGQLKALVERVEHVEGEIKSFNDDKKEIYATARRFGYDVKIIKRVVRLRAMDRDKCREEEEILDLYMTALEGT